MTSPKVEPRTSIQALDLPILPVTPDAAPQSAGLVVQRKCPTTEGIAMARKPSAEFSEDLNLRISVQQRVFISDLAALHGLTPSDVVRGFIDTARVEQAMEVLDGVPR